MEQEYENLCGITEEIVYRKEETGFTVMDLSTEDGELVTVVGVLPDISPGEELQLTGRWDNHNKFGRQFRAELCERSMPNTEAQVLKYLSSGSVKGIGPATAARIVEAFGENTFDVLANSPERLAGVRGISMKKAQAICQEFKEQFAVREIMMSLENLGLSSTYAIRTYQVLGDDSVKRVQENPYLLCTPEIGLPFESADSIAASLENPPNETYRIHAGILHVVTHNLGNGHTCLPRDKLLHPCASLLGTNDDTIDIAIDEMTETFQLCTAKLQGREFVFLPYIYDAELQTARRIKVMVNFPPAGSPVSDEDILKVERENGLHYEKKQREAIVTALERGILILTGGPGTGKTTTVNGILELFEERGLNVVLTAPTGRAAQRMSEISGREAKTIHRLREAERTGRERMTFARNVRNPIEADAVIVDELSMVDTVVFAALMDALPLTCRLVMVGDSDQLPPVGAGNVLSDMIASGLLPVVELTEVFRQAQMSLIVTNAHRVVAGEMPELDRTDRDFFHMERNSARKTAEDIVGLYTTRLPAAYGYNPVEDIEILCPSRKGECGTVNLNRILQEAVNPPMRGKSEIRLQTRTFREGDKVMQVKNNYNIEWTREGEEGSGIFNGDVGIIRAIDRASGQIKINFEGRIVTIPSDNLGDIELAYAVTVHKSQGSEFQAVIMPIIDVPPQLCYRNLFYTAITRARSKMITIGRKAQIAQMVENDRKFRRYSALRDFLLMEE